MLYYYFKWTLYGALGVLIIGAILNYFVAILQANKQKQYMEKVDLRMNCLTEIVNNIKIIKLNSYTEYFMNRLLGKRAIEIWQLIIKIIVIIVNWNAAILIPPILILTCFSLLLAHGFTMSVADAFAAVYTLNMLRGPMWWLPYFLGELM